MTASNSCTLCCSEPEPASFFVKAWLLALSYVVQFTHHILYFRCHILSSRMPKGAFFDLVNINFQQITERDCAIVVTLYEVGTMMKSWAGVNFINFVVLNVCKASSLIDFETLAHNEAPFRVEEACYFAEKEGRCRQSWARRGVGRFAARNRGGPRHLELRGWRRCVWRLCNNYFACLWAFIWSERRFRFPGQRAGHPHGRKRRWLERDPTSPLEVVKHLQEGTIFNSTTGTDAYI